jgi:hypothetical protein
LAANAAIASPPGRHLKHRFSGLDALDIENVVDEP